jgi:DNA-binding NarL/FixJ family response regulator
MLGEVVASLILQWKDVMNIVVIDSHELYRDGLVKLINDLFAQAVVLVAGNCSRAREIASEKEIGLALIELCLTDGVGVELNEFNRRFPVAVISSVVEATLIERAVTAGTSGFLPRSLSRKQTGEVLMRILGGGVWFPGGESAVDPIEHTPGAMGAPLTVRQRQVLALLARGLTNKAIARRLGLAEKTVKTHVTEIFKRLGVSCRAEAIARAFEGRLEIYQQWLSMSWKSGNTLSQL